MKFSILFSLVSFPLLAANLAPTTTTLTADSILCSTYGNSGVGKLVVTVSTSGASPLSGTINLYQTLAGSPDYLVQSWATPRPPSSTTYSVSYLVGLGPRGGDTLYYATYSGDQYSAASQSAVALTSSPPRESALRLSVSSPAITQGVPLILNAGVDPACSYGDTPLAVPITISGATSYSATLTETGTMAPALTISELGPGVQQINADAGQFGKASISVAVSDPAVPGYAVTVRAGTPGVYASGGDGGAASAASFAAISAVAVDSKGNVYVADTGSIRKIDTTGVINAYVPGVSARALAVGPGDVLYWATGGRVYKSVNGQAILVVAGSGASAPYQGDGIAATLANLSTFGIAFGPDGTLYITDCSGPDGSCGTGYLAQAAAFAVRAVRNGIIQTVAGAGTATVGEGVAAKQASLMGHGAVAIDGNGLIYLGVSTDPNATPTTSTLIYQIDGSGILHRVADSVSASTIGNVLSLTWSPKGELLVGDGGYLGKISGGQLVQVAGAGSLPAPSSSVNALLTSASSILAVDNAGNFYEGNYNLLKVYTPYGNLFNTALRYVPVTPCRVVDTRSNNNAVLYETTQNFPINASVCGIPATAQAYSLNVTAIPYSLLGYMSVWPTDMPQPLVSTLNSDGRVKADAVIMRAGDNNSVSVFATDTIDVVLDINGYFEPAGTSSSELEFYPLAPCRVSDTRFGTGPLAGPYLAGGKARVVPVQSSSCGVPGSAKAYSLNFTAIPHEPIGFLATWPTGSPQPLVSTLNAPTGTVTANAAIVPAGPDGGIEVYSSNDTDLAIDINGYFAAPSSSGLSLYAILPCRAYDSRFVGKGQPINGETSAAIGASSCGIPASAEAFVLNSTVVPNGSLSFLSLWPDGQTKPWVSTLNAQDGHEASNMALVPTTNGTVDIFTTNPAAVILDVTGYFAP